LNRDSEKKVELHETNFVCDIPLYSDFFYDNMEIIRYYYSYLREICMETLLYVTEIMIESVRHLKNIRIPVSSDIGLPNQ